MNENSWQEVMKCFTEQGEVKREKCYSERKPGVMGRSLGIGLSLLLTSSVTLIK